jgi:hypothetical protein
LEETQDEQEIIERVAALDIGKTELVGGTPRTTDRAACPGVP